MSVNVDGERTQEYDDEDDGLEEDVRGALHRNPYTFSPRVMLSLPLP